MANRNPLDRSAAWTVLLEQGFFKDLTGDADRDMTTKFLDDFYASGVTRMWEFAETWAPDSPEQELAEKLAAAQEADAQHAEPYLPQTPAEEVAELQSAELSRNLAALQCEMGAERDAEIDRLAKQYPEPGDPADWYTISPDAHPNQLDAPLETPYLREIAGAREDMLSARTPAEREILADDLRGAQEDLDRCREMEGQAGPPPDAAAWRPVFEAGDKVLTPVGPGEFVRMLAEDDYLVEVGGARFTVTPDDVQPFTDHVQDAGPEPVDEQWFPLPTGPALDEAWTEHEMEA
jgi:hypothetical protein